MTVRSASYASASLPQRDLAGSVQAGLLVFVAVAAACLVGIWTRPVDFLASVWPANAVMLGILLRQRFASRAPIWLAGSAALLATDMLTGTAFRDAALLNTANLVSIGVAYVVYTRGVGAASGDLRHQPATMLYVILAAAAGGCAAGLVGGVANSIMFDSGPLSGWTFWFATEFVNYVAILPVVLSLPGQWRDVAAKFFALTARDFLPFCALLVSFVAAAAIGGPGAIAFPVPALLWCGLAYSVFPTAVLTLLFGLWTLLVITAGYFPSVGGEYDKMALASIRLGASLVAVVPIVLSSVMQDRNDMLMKLHKLASCDGLTGVLNRRAFAAAAEVALARDARGNALIMVDLDHFKSVNDRYGHAGGDDVLVAFAGRAANCLRANALLGRLGGEEFAILIPDCTEENAWRIAERLRLAMHDRPVRLRDGRTVSVTASLGVAQTTASNPLKLDQLFSEADAALYRAKHSGRNRVEIASVTANTPRVSVESPAA